MAVGSPNSPYYYSSGGSAPHPAARPPVRPPARPAPHPAATPWWALPPAALQAQALAQAQAYYKPVLDEYHSQQTQAQEEAARRLAGVQKLIQIVQAAAGQYGKPITDAYNAAANQDYGTSDLADQARSSEAAGGQAYSNIGSAYAGEAGNAGEAQYLNVVQDSNKIARDLLDQITQTTAKIPGTAQDIFGQLQSAQGKYRSEQLAQSKYGFEQQKYAYSLANQQVAQLNKGPWLYYTATGKDGMPEVRLAKDKRGKPISTHGMSEYDKATLSLRAAASRETHAYHQQQVGLKQQTLAQGQQKISQAQQRINIAKAKAAKTAAKVPAKIIGLSGQPLTSAEVNTYTGDVVGIINDSQKRGSITTAIDRLSNSPVPPALWKPLVAKRYGIPPWAVKGTAPNVAGLRRMAVPRLHRIAVFLGYDAPALNPKKPWIGSTKQGLVDFIVNASGK